MSEKLGGGSYLYVERLENCPKLDSSIPVKVTTMGNVIEVQYMDRRNQKQTIQMLPGGEEYLNFATGEVSKVQHHESRVDLVKNLQRTFKSIRGIINANVTDTSKIRWITLTYEENMMDRDRLYKDFKKFNMRFQYYVEKQGYGKAEYIVIAEPQGRGAWHMHLIYIFDDKAPFIPNNEILEPMWGHGFTKIKQLDDVDNVGAYLTAYLGDMELSEWQKTRMEGDEDIGSHAIKEVEVIDDYGKAVKKRYVKGGRLHLYPAKFNIYRTSRGIKRPISEMMSQENAEKKVSEATLTFEKTVRLTDDETQFESLIHTKYYNTVRGKIQD